MHIDDQKTTELCLDKNAKHEQHDQTKLLKHRTTVNDPEVTWKAPTFCFFVHPWSPSTSSMPSRNQTWQTGKSPH